MLAYPAFLGTTRLPIFLDEQDEDCDNQRVNSDGFCKCQAQNHVLLNGSDCLGIPSQGLQSFSRKQTNAESGAQRTETNSYCRAQRLQVYNCVF